MWKNVKHWTPGIVIGVLLGVVTGFFKPFSIGSLTSFSFSYGSWIQPASILIIIILGLGLLAASLVFYFRPANKKSKNERGKDVSAGFVIVAALTAFFVPTLSLITSDSEKVLTVNNLSNWNESGMYVDINYPNPLTIPISNSIYEISKPLWVDIAHPHNISIDSVKLQPPLGGIISTDGNFTNSSKGMNKVTYTANISAMHSDDVSNKTYIYKLRLNFINETSNTRQVAIVPFEWTVISKDLTWLGYFWIVLAGVVASRLISFVVDTGENEPLNIDRREAVWLVYTFIIAVLAFASFKDEITGLSSIMFSVVAAFVFGFGSDKVLELARAFPRTSQPTTSGPSQVQGLKIVAPRGTTQELQLDWTENPESDIIRYNIYRDTSTGFTPDISQPIGTPTTNSFLDTKGLASTTPYYYVVAAVDSKYVVGPVSSEASGTPN